MVTNKIPKVTSWDNSGLVSGKVSNGSQYNIKTLYYSSEGAVTMIKENGDDVIVPRSSYGTAAPAYGIKSMYWGADGHLHVITINDTDHIV